MMSSSFLLLLPVCSQRPPSSVFTPLLSRLFFSSFSSLPPTPLFLKRSEYFYNKLICAKHHLRTEVLLNSFDHFIVKTKRLHRETSESPLKELWDTLKPFLLIPGHRHLVFNGARTIFGPKGGAGKDILIGSDCPEAYPALSSSLLKVGP